MPSRRILNRLPHVSPVVRTARAAGTVIGEAFRRHFARLPPEIERRIAEYREARPPGSPAVGVDQACFLVADALEKRHDVLVDADRTYDEAKLRQKKKRRRRDRRVRRLYRAVGQLRRHVKDVLGNREGARYLRFLEGETAREPTSSSSRPTAW